MTIAQQTKIKKASYINKYKETTADETVMYLKNILKNLEIKVEEIWKNSSEFGVYSVRVRVPNSNIGANGKGVTKEYALASGYAELMERLQNMALIPRDNETFDVNDKKIYFSQDERLMSMRQILSDYNPVMDEIVNNFGFGNELSVDATADILENYFANKKKNDKFVTVPYYSLKSKKNIYLPIDIIDSIYGTNGMCAGNTHEEALVQGLSEIFERFIQKQFIFENYSYPVIDLSLLNSTINSIIAKICNKGYQVKIFDCSNNGNYPVVALYIKNINSLKYGLKFGSHIDLNIAVERTLTESMQGQDIEDFITRNTYEFDENIVKSKSNCCNLYDLGYGSYPYHFLNDNKSFICNLSIFKSSLCNNKMLKMLINKILNCNKDLLIRDNTVLGFPSFRLIVPGFSEMEQLTKCEYEIQNNVNNIIKFILNIDNSDYKTTIKIISTSEKLLNYFTYNKLSLLIKLDNNQSFPFAYNGLDLVYFIAICYLSIKEYSACLSYFKIIYENKYINEYDKNLISCFVTYCKGKVNKKEENYIITLLNNLFDFSIITEFKKICNDVFIQYKNLKVYNFDKNKIYTSEFFGNIDNLENKTIIRLIENMYT